MKKLSERFVAGGFLLALLMLCGVGAEFYANLRKLTESRQSVEHTYQVLETLNKILSGMETTDRARRSYYFSRDEGDLASFQTGVQETHLTLATVRQLTSNNLEQQHRLRKLAALIASKFALSKQVVALDQQTQPNQARLIEPRRNPLVKQTLSLQKDIQTQLKAMDAAERSLLQQRIAAIDTSVHQTVLVVSIAYTLSFGLLVSVFGLLLHQIRIRQRAEAVLQKHSEEIYDLYNKAPCGYHSLDATGNFVRINDTELGWLGYTREEVIDKKTFIELTTAYSQLVFQETFPKFKAQGWISDVEFEMVRKDGTVLPVSLSATSVKDAAGSFAMSRSTLFDISERKRAQAALQGANEQLEARVQERTAALSQVNALLHSELLDRKQAEQALSKSEKQLRTITNALPVLISYVDADRRYRFNNRAYEQWFGCDSTTLYGQHLREVVGESAYQAIEPYAQAVLSGQEVLYESAVPYKDGGLRWVRAIYIPDFGEQGAVKGYFALISDITDRKLAEAALRESEQRLSLAIEGSGMATWDINLQTGNALWSAQHFTLLGYEPVPSGEATLSMWRHCVHPDDLESVEQAVAQAIQAQSLYRSEHRIRRADNGQIVWLAAFGRIFYDETGQAVRFLGIILDISDRKQAALALQYAKDGLEIQVQERTAALKQTNDDLQRSNQELEQFAYVASHDLQEPLRAVMGYTQLLTQDYRDRLDDTAQSYGAYIVDGAKRMQQLIQDLLHYSRIGTRDLVFAPTDCTEVLKQVLSNLQVAIAESNAAITYDPLPIVTADASQLVQLFQNLIGNAIKFCRNDAPKIHISARRVEEQGEQFKTQNSKLKTFILHPVPLTPQTPWLFSVRDNGIGIKPRYLERIFEIFKRLHTRTEFPGTGIGLAICKKIVDRHDGSIWAESQPGIGTIFYFTIPYHDHTNV